MEKLETLVLVEVLQFYDCEEDSLDLVFGLSKKT
jgi:hypothetical protein